MIIFLKNELLKIENQIKELLLKKTKVQEYLKELDLST